VNIDQINNTVPGKNLDKLVATEVMKNNLINDEVFGILEMYKNNYGENIYIPLRSYSKELTYAKLIITKMCENGYNAEASYWKNEKRPEIICKAALRTIIIKKKKNMTERVKSKLRVIK
jgi:hypothetical protein